MKHPPLRWWEWLFAAILVAILLFTFFGCAVPVRNENNDKPLLTAPTGTAVTKADGTTVYNPALPQPDKGNYQHEEPTDWMGIAKNVLDFAAMIAIGHTVSQRGRLKRAESGEDEGWDHALNLAKQVPPKDDA